MLRTPIGEHFLKQTHALSGTLADLMYGAFSGIPERGTIPSPFQETREGLITEDGNFRRGLEFGIRPLRVNNPYVFVSKGLGDLDASVRYYPHKWNFNDPTLEVMARTKLDHLGFIVGAGFQFQPERIGRDDSVAVLSLERRLSENGHGGDSWFILEASTDRRILFSFVLRR